MKSQPFTVEDFVTRMSKFCAYRDRSHAEARRKLRELGCRAEMAEEVLVQLIRLDFLNEERYARAFARGKYRMSGWGREKIRLALGAEQVHERLIAKVLKEEVDEDEYLGILRKLASKKVRSLGGLETFEQRSKVKAYLFGKGFEGDKVDTVLREIQDSGAAE